MGNHGMTNWKLRALFAISLMLIAGLFSNAAIAADGDGTVSVQWMHGEHDLDLKNQFRYGEQLYEYGPGGKLGLLWNPLPAGSRENQLVFSYRVGTNMAGGEVKFHLPAGWKILKSAENILGTGGTVTDDKVKSDAYERYKESALVEVREDLDGASGGDPLIIYRLNRDGVTVTREGLTSLIGDVVAGSKDNDDEDVANAGRVSIGDDDTSITVELSNDWRSGGELVVALRNVQTAVPRSLSSRTGAADETADLPYHNYPIVVSSKKSGRLDQLDPVLIDHDGDNKDKVDADDTDKVYSRQPTVKVGNILGLRGAVGQNEDHDKSTPGVQYHGPDQIAREFKVEPTDVWEGEANKTFMVSFTAEGPMYDAAGADATIAITIPPELLPTVFGPDVNEAGYIMNHVSVTASGRVQPSGNLDVGSDMADEVYAGKDGVTINLDRIDKGAKVVLTYTFEGGEDYENATIGDDKKVNRDDPTAIKEISAFKATTKVPLRDGKSGRDEDATSITGGNIRPQVGSGKITFEEDQVEAGEDVSRITLIYEADTALDGVTLEVDVKGIQLVDDDDNVEPAITSLQDEDEDLYGFVDEGTGTTSDPGLTITEGKDAAITTIAYDGLTFTKAGETFTFNIENVRIQEEGASLVFETRIGPDKDKANLKDDTHGLGVNNPILYITDTVDDAVEFKVDGNTFASFNASQEVDAITFSFQAKTTSIKDGQVRFTIPRNWTGAVKPHAENKIEKHGQLTVSGGGTTDENRVDNTSLSGRSVTVDVPMLKIGDTITIAINAFTGDDEIAKKVTVQPDATDEDEYEAITGYFWTSSPIRGRGHTAGTVDVEITNAGDGYGDATIEPKSVKAGSDDNKITVEFTAAGTMDGGAVRLVIPDGWGSLQDDDATEANYVEVDVSRGRGTATANVGSSAAIAYLEGVEKGSRIRFTYGGGTVESRNGAEAQSTIAVADPAAFMIETDGDGDNSFEAVRGEQRNKVEKDATKKEKTIPLGKVYRDSVGELRVEVTGADDGSGTAEVEIANTGQGEAMYPDDEDVDGDRDRTELVDGMRIHAGDMGTYLMFTYTPSQTIQDGQLKFTAPGEWSDPQNNPGSDGYTYFSETGTADIDHIEFDEDDGSVTVDIGYINPDGTIEIHYGAYEGEDDGSGAHAPSSSTISSAFTVQIRGGSATTNQFSPIKTLKGKSIAVRVYAQASGGGNATASVSDDEDDVGAGDMNREVTVVYTAAGEINNGMLKLTVPWSHPLMDNVAISSTGSVGSSSASDFGGYYVGDPDDAEDDMEVPEGGPGAKDVLVDGVNLDEGDTVTFVYSAPMVQAEAGDASFGVAVAGGDGPGEDPVGVTADPSDALTISVGDASKGSGSGMLELAQAVIANTGGNTLTFIYTPTGAITNRKLDIRVKVPSGWSPPTDNIDADARGSFTVTQKKLDGEVYKLQTAAATAVEKIGPFDREMAARLKFGESVGANDQIVFTYENADSPTTIGPSTFVMHFGDSQVTMDTDLTVLVGSGKDAAMLMVDVSADMILVEDDESVTVTVMLQDEDGNEVPATEDMDVMLASDSAAGSFMVDGEAATMVTITAGTSSVMADYTDSTLSEATITASSGTLTDGTATVTVTTDVVEITSATFSIADSDGVARDIARDGDAITVTVVATPLQDVTFEIGTIVIGGGSDMTGDGAGNYTGSHTLAMGIQDGTYAITVSIGAVSESAGSVMVDNTAPTVSDTSASPEMVANGEMVTISAMVDGATSVMADVSMLDTEAASVALTDADGDGTYTGMHTISAENGADNGTYTITVTAMDAAGNSSDPDTAMVTLQNAISFTSTLSQGISLFHVPLDEEGLDTVGDLETKLGDGAILLITYDRASAKWNSRSSDVAITASLGILVSMSAETTVTFEGQPWADGSISLAIGSNLIGLPVNDARVTMASQISGLFATGTVSSVIVASGGSFKAAAADDVAVAGDAAYLVIATAAGSATLSGDGWSNGTVGAAPIALASYTVDNQTPVLDVHGSVVDEITGLVREGFRVKVKNLETKTALSEITSVEAADGYNMTFVDLSDSYAARVGDVLEISAESPNPLIGVQPVRHTVTVDDVKNSTIQLEELIAYEIPAETELLRNYPNPFNPETWIPYHLSEDADVKLTIYDINGEVVRDIDVGHQTAAKYDTRAKAIYWDGRNRFGEQVASGIYFYHLDAGEFSGTRKMVILK